MIETSFTTEARSTRRLEGLVSQHLSLDSGCHSVCAACVKIHQKAYTLVAELQVCQQMRFVDRQESYLQPGVTYRVQVLLPSSARLSSVFSVSPW